MNNLMEKITSICKRRGFVFPGSEIYGGLTGTWDLGPLGTEVRNQVLWAWRKFFIYSRDDIFLISSGILSNAKIWEASGHVKSFVDPMVDCKKCKTRFRVDRVDTKKGCPECGAKKFTKARPFNMMFKTFIGPVEDTAYQTYLRPETAQGMFVNFKNIVDSMHPKIPFGIAQVGKAFRNEITPGNFIFRIREFEQMEIEWFCQKEEWEKWFEYWMGEMKKWLLQLGLDEKKIHIREVPEKERAHYSKRTADIDYDFPFGREELYGIAYRTDFDVKNHSKESGIEFPFMPHVVEPTFGLERTLLALFSEHYTEEKDRVILKFPPKLAPVKAAVFPLLANKPELVAKARWVYEMLRSELSQKSGNLVMWDDRGNIGKRYYSQDEIGTPWCVTIDHQTLKDDTITVRDRDTMNQERVKISDLVKVLKEKLV